MPDIDVTSPQPVPIFHDDVAAETRFGRHMARAMDAGATVIEAGLAVTTYHCRDAERLGYSSDQVAMIRKWCVGQVVNSLAAVLVSQN